MNKPLLIALLATICGLSISPCHAEPAVPKTVEPQPIGPKPGELVTVRGFQLSITADSAAFAVSTPILLKATISNVDNKRGLIYESTNSAIYRIEVKTVAQETVPLTRYGQRREAGKRTQFANGALEIAPGQSEARSFVLNQIFDMTSPGEYIVRVSHNAGFSMEDDPTPTASLDMTSNVLHITVR